MRQVSFRGEDWQAGYRRVIGSDFFSTPSRDINSVELARADGAVDLFKRFKSKDINITGYLNADTDVNFDLALDAIKLNVLQSGALRFGYAGGYREWQATLQSLNIAQGTGDISYAPYSALFHAAQPFALDGTTQTLFTLTSATAASNNMLLNAIGTWFALPIITITINAMNPTITPITLTISNPAESRYLNITRTFAAGDTITIDTVNSQIFHNSTLIRPDGQFPIWLPGTGAVTISDNATTRILSAVATYKPRWQ